MILGLDQGIKLTGWCVGAGDGVPTAGAWRFDHIDPNDTPLLYSEYKSAFHRLLARFPAVSQVIYEAPFIDRYRDKVTSLRRRFGIDAVLELTCHEQNLIVEESPFGQLKRALAGFAKADKDDMVATALKLGVALPKTKADGREDAADAVAAWLIGVRHYAPRFQPEWDRRLYSPRGALL